MLDEHVQGRPAQRLRPYVPFYSGYRQEGVAPAVHRGLPSPYLTLIFTMDDPLVIARHPDPRQAAGRYDSLAGGLHLTPALITHDGRQSGVQVTVSPLGCRALFGLPASELRDQDVDAAELFGPHVVDEVRHGLLTAPDWPRRFAVLDTVLTRVVRDDEVAPQIAYALERVRTPSVSVAKLADEVGWSGRHLTDRFRAEIGLRPKEAARVARFDRARRALRPSARLADIAAAHGFADQSHFVREFHAFAGCTPSRWIADEFGFIQALSAAGANDGRHDL
ncbi:helix-turn-helix domain-containing protein [Actinoplanes sp. NPDC051411]|jgi:AraC-like DNA-binding protein|uniref:helix-turn-helix domain-containing protein n=1 Tax=Actinoplanes sp. NPDC051411 TaxID=3155522 RepID=UPI003437B10F